MEQFWALVIVALIIWMIIRSTSRKSKRTPISQPRGIGQTGSTVRLSQGQIVLSYDSPKGRRNSQFRVEEIESIKLKSATNSRQGMFQFELKSGMKSEVLAYSKSDEAGLRELISEIEELRKSGNEYSDARPQATAGKSAKPGKVIHADDGVFRTESLEFISGDGGRSGEKTLIVMDNPEFAVLDIETTGFSPSRGDRIVEIAVVVIDSQGQILEKWSTTVNPKRKMNATHIHGLTENDVSESPEFSEISERVFELLENRIVVAHNASFDCQFILSELATANVSIQPSRFAVFDTMKLVGQRFPEATNKKLDTVLTAAEIDRLDLPGRGEHSALTDAYATALLLKNYLDWNRNSVFTSVSWPLIENTNKPEFVTSQKAQQIELVQFSEVEFLNRVAGGPDSEILIQRFTEVYFTGFMPEQEPIIAEYQALWSVNRAERVTKKRCSLVVTADTTRASNAVKNAMKWDIPVVSLQHVHLVSTTD